MKPERIQIFPTFERWERIPAQGRILLPCESTKDASFLVGAATHLAEKFVLNGLSVTVDVNRAVAVTFETESHESFSDREQDLLERLEALWAIVSDSPADEV